MAAEVGPLRHNSHAEVAYEDPSHLERCFLDTTCKPIRISLYFTLRLYHKIKLSWETSDVITGTPIICEKFNELVNECPPSTLPHPRIFPAHYRSQGGGKWVWTDFLE
jgi:hypothetical protein